MKSIFLILIIFISVNVFSQNKANFAKSYELEYKLDYDGAINAIKSESSNYFGAARLGYLYFTAKNYKSAIDAYKQAISLNGKSIEAHLGLANVYYANQNWKELDDNYSKILTLRFML